MKVLFLKLLSLVALYMFRRGNSLTIDNDTSPQRNPRHHNLISPQAKATYSTNLLRWLERFSNGSVDNTFGNLRELTVHTRLGLRKETLLHHAFFDMHVEATELLLASGSRVSLHLFICVLPVVPHSTFTLKANSGYRRLISHS